MQYAGIQNKTPVQQYDNNNTDAQKWIIKDIGNGYYNIISKCNGYYVTASKNECGTKMFMNEYNSAYIQKFKFEEAPEKKGIDVSHYQGNIDWKAVKNDGIDFAFIRVGYRGYATGVIVRDSKFEYNIKNAISNNINCGV